MSSISHDEAQEMHLGIGLVLQHAEDHPGTPVPPEFLVQLERSREIAAIVVCDTQPGGCTA